MTSTRFLCAVSVASLATMSAPAWAQAAGSPPVADVAASDIVVTARRVEERLQDVPISITVFNQQQLTNRNVVNAGDLSTYTPSLTANARFGAENTSFAIRGFVQDPSTAPSVAVYFAEVAALRAAGGTTLGNGAGPGSFFDLQNVQVLKGAQGTLFGRNTTGGAVLLVPQKPTERLEGYVEGSVGSDNLFRAQGVLNVPLAENLRFRFGVDHETKDGYLHNISGLGPKDFANVHYTAVRASAVWDVTPNLENYIIGTYSLSDTHGFLPQLFVCAPGIYPAGSANNLVANLGCQQIARRTGKYTVENATIAPQQRVKQWQVIDTTTWKATDNITIKNIASYGEFREFFRSSPYGENLILPTGPQAGQRLLKAQSAPPVGGLSAGESTFTEELQLQGTGLDNKLTYQFGGYTEQSDPIGFTGSISGSTAVCKTTNDLQCVSAGITGLTSLVLARLNSQKFRDYGVYGQGTYKLTEQFSVTAGARYTWDRTSSTSQQVAFVPLPITTNPPVGRCLVGTATTGTFSTCQATFRQKASRPTWLADVDYKPNDDILVYLKYTRGYRAGGVKTDGGALFSVFGPEKVNTYEGGIKTSFRGSFPGTFNVTGFYSDLFHQQLAGRLDPNPTGPLAGSTAPQVVVSNGTSRIYGAEVEATVSPIAGVNINANYAYLNSKLKSIAPLAAGGALYLSPVVGTTAVGFPLGYTPRNKYSVTASYTLPLDASVGRITLAATFSHSDHFLANAGYIIPIVAPTAANPNPIIPISLTGKDYGQVPGVNLLNFNVNWNNVFGKPFDLSFFMTNVANKYYSATQFGGIGSFGYDARALGEPREFGFRGKVRF